MDHLDWMNKALENFKAAQLCFERDCFNACANRLYYAMFQAGAAALLKNGVKPAGEKIGHDWLQAAFAEQLIHRRKIFARKFRPYLSDAYRVRELADYRPSPVGKKVVAGELKKAKELIDVISKEVSYETQP